MGFAKRYEIKNCPFCGGKSYLDTDGSKVWIICLSCGATSAKRYIDYHPDKVYELWNSRVINSQ